MNIVPDNIFISFIILFVSFAILAKSADTLVEGAVTIAFHMRIPKIIIGLVLVGFATTAPEFTVSLVSALRGYPEIALGNAVGSVITNDGLALALGILVAPAAITVDSQLLKRIGIFIIVVDLLAFLLALNGRLGRLEGIVLILILIIYLTSVVVFEKKRRVNREKKGNSNNVQLPEGFENYIAKSLKIEAIKFIFGVAGVIIAAELLVNSSLNIASFFMIPEIVVGLTLVAVGTSLPEIATCIAAFRKGHGDLAFGDIIGADILNILWIIGTASIVNPIIVDRNIILFTFPWMFLIVFTMLLLARHRYTLNKWKGAVLLVLYVTYIIAMLLRFYAPV